MNYVQGTRSNLDYDKIKEEAEKPIRERSKIIKTNRGTFRTPRKYHLSDDKIKQLKNKANTPNPYRIGGFYFALVQSLIELGTNRKHSFLEVKIKLKEIMSKWTDKKTKENGWISFKNKKSKNSLCAHDVNGRIIQNAFVLQRLTGFHPYGEKLRQLEMCIDVFKDDNDLPKFQLRIGIDGNVIPINEFRNKK